MKRQTAYVLGGVGVGVIALAINPLLALFLVIAVIAAPAIAYALLDPSQKRRLKGIARKQIGPGSRR